MVNVTEKVCIDLLLKTAKDNGETSPRCVTMTRQQNRNSLTRIVKFALVVTSNNTALIDALIQACIPLNDNLHFVGSEMNLQGDLDIDYLYFEAKILSR